MLALWFAASCGLALAHSSPHSIVKLGFLAHSVQAEVLVPESELAFATAAERSSDSFADYLLRHLSAETPQGVPWKVEIRSVRNISYLEHAYLSAHLEFTPPRGAPASSFVLVDDAVTHEVRSHLVMVLAPGEPNPELLGALQYPTRRLTIHRPATAAQK
jgi:hypothetical protein